MVFNFNALEVFQIAIKIEENGKAFYEKASSRVDDAEVKKLFEDLALQEVQHRIRFEKLKSELPPRAASSTVWDPENETDLYLKMVADEHVFGPGSDVESQLARIKDARDALRLAMQFEKDSVIFFLSMQEVTDEQKGKQYIGQLVKEEQEHLRLLSLQLRKMGR